jgi:polyhydroxyalkanoate synthesis regulator phasin
MGGNIISKLKVKLGLDKSEFSAGLSKSEKETKSFGKSISKIGGLIAGAFGVQQVIAFGKEVIKLAGEAEGVQRAFDRIGGGKIFESLKTATRGTVSNLELMRKTVMAQNLGVPVENLAKLFEFAAARAADTGESVDYLVSSIVTGIGRKSPLILDNLGISAIALKEKMNGVGLGTASVGQVAEAVGKIAEAELNKIGKAATTNGQKIQSLAASWDNVKLSIGRAVTASQEYAAISNLVFGLDLAFNKADNSQKKLEEGAKRIFESFKKNGKISKEDAKARIKALTDENKELLTNGDLSNKNVRDRRKGNLALIRLLRKVSEAPKEGVAEEIVNIETLSKKIENLQTDQKTATGSRLSDINREIAALEDQIKTLKNLGLEIQRLPQQTPVDISTQVKPIDQGTLNLPTPEPQVLPTTITTDGMYAATQAFDDYNKKVQESTNTVLTAQQTQQAYGSILGSVGQIAQASGDSQIATMLNVAATTIQAVATMMPALFASATGKAVESGAALPFPYNIAAIAAGIATVASAFSGIGGGGGVSSGGGAVTSIDTTGFSSPTTNDSTRRATTQAQNISVEVTGTIKGKDIALANNQGQKQLKR